MPWPSCLLGQSVLRVGMPFLACAARPSKHLPGDGSSRLWQISEGMIHCVPNPKVRFWGPGDEVTVLPNSY